MWKPGSAGPTKKASDSRRHSEPSSLGRRSPPMQAMNGGSGGGGGDHGSSGRATNRNRNSSDGVVRTPPLNGGGPSGTGRKIHSAGAAKKLSGATLGMRFMQRKAEAEAAAERRRRAEEEAKVAASREEEVPTMDSSRRGDAKKGASDEGEGEPMEVDSDGLATTKNIGMPQLATDADMYGAEADIIGRRSFGGFNRAVGETWKAALQMRRKSDADAAAGKKPISDEELLRRYEKYVRGEDDSPDVDRASAAPIGNLAEKVKNQNRHQTSPRRRAGTPHGSGQKRRRRDDRMR